MTKQSKQESKKKYPCGKCNKDIASNSRAVLCRSDCQIWYHLKCTKLTLKGFNELSKTKLPWTCNKCMNKKVDGDSYDESSDESDNNSDHEKLSLDKETRQEEEITNEVNLELKEQLENVNCILKTLNGDLILAQEEIKSLKNQNASLELIVLQKEEEIIILQREIEGFKNVSERPKQEEDFILPKKTWGSKRYSLPNPTTTIVNTNVSSTGKKLNKQVNKKKLYSSAVGGEQKQGGPKLCSTPYRPILNETDVGPNFISENYYQVLAPLDDSDHVNSELDTQDKVSKILICADSHGGDLSWHVKNQIDKLRWRGDIRNEEKFLPVGFVRPGGQTSQILSEKNIKEELVNERDILVIISGTNDVARNEGDGALAEIEETLNKFSEKRVILVDLPNRNDLPDWSCVNLATKKANEGLKNLSEKFVNVTLVQASKAERRMHTAHGMHFKPSGKAWLAERICEAAGISNLKSSSTSPTNTTTDRPTKTTNLGNGQPKRKDPPPLTLQSSTTNS